MPSWESWEGCGYRHSAALAAFDAIEELLGERPCGQRRCMGRGVARGHVERRAEFHLDRNEPELGLAALAAARPVLEARGSPTHKHYFYWGLAYRAGNAEPLAGVELVEFLLLHGDLAEAREYLERSLALSERVGQVLGRANSLWALTLTALRSHDVEAVRSFRPMKQPTRIDGEAPAVRCLW